MIDDLPPLREVIAEHGLNAKKSLGQNFLLDLNVTARIARAAGPLKDATVLEIGPGPGGLTRALLAEGAGNVVAIERDERCLPALQRIAERYPDRLTVIAGDALSLDHAALVRDHEGPVRIAANLPYNIATPLLVGWLTTAWPPFWTSMTLMFQREVAERIVADVGDGAYGRLAVLAGWRTHASIAFDLGPQVFTPPPKVTSSVVTFEPRRDPEEVNVALLQRVAGLAFGQRRKMLRQSLKSVGGAELVERAGLDPTMRAERVDVSGFVRLARALLEEA